MKVVLQGRIYFVHGDDIAQPSKLSRDLLAAPQTIVIPPRTLHRVEAIEDSVIMEVSTPQLDDVFRLLDDYGRSKS